MHTQATWGGWHIVADPGSSHYRSADSCLLKLPILTCDTCCGEKRIIQSIIPFKTTVCCRFGCLLPSSGANLHTNDCSDVTDSRWGGSTWAYWINKIRAKSQSGACMCVSDEDSKVEALKKSPKLLQSRGHHRPRRVPGHQLIEWSYTSNKTLPLIIGCKSAVKA